MKYNNFNKKMLLLILVVSFSIVTSGISFANTTYDFKFATYAPSGHVFTRVAEEFGKKVFEASEGRIQITVYPNAALCSGADQFKSVSLGMVDMTDLVSDYMVGEVEMLGMGCLPFAYDWEKSHLIGEEARDMITKRLRKDNVEFLFNYGSGGNTLFLKEKPITPPSLKGMKIRASGVHPIELLNAIGSVPVRMSTGEIYMAVETGMIDAATVGVLSWYAGNVYEALPVIYNLTITPSWFTTVINEDSFNRLPDELKVVLIDEAVKFGPIATQMVIDTKEKLISEAVENKGCFVYEPTNEEVEEWEKAAQTIQGKFIEIGGAEAEEIWEVLKKYQ